MVVWNDVDNVEAMTSKGLRASCLSKYTEADASYNVELTTITFIGYSLCYAIGFFINILNKII
jgi:hypothetical protein